MEHVMAAMRQPLPALTDLTLQFSDETQSPPIIYSVIPDSFLGESATTCLRSLRLINIPFPLPALRKLLLSAADLVKIRIWRIPNSWYISPEEMVVTCLSTLTRLQEFELGFQSRDNWGNRRLPPETCTRFVLPALTSLQFKGVYEYMEDLMARIDAPQLDNLKIILFYQPVLDAPQLAQFISRTPRFKALNKLHVLFDGRGVFVLFPWTLHRGLQVRVLPGPPNPFSILVELCGSSFLRTLIPIVKHLHILEYGSTLSYWRESIESSHWLRPFSAVKEL